MTATPVTQNQNKLLRLAFLLDAAVTGVNGAAYLLAAGPIHDLLGPEVGFLRSIGVFLLVWGVAVGVIGTRPAVNRALAMTVIAVNALWAATSVVLALMGDLGFTTLGVIWAVAQALVVGGLALFQNFALQRSR